MIKRGIYMKKIYSILLVLVIGCCLLLTGCRVKLEDVNKIEVGMTQTEVVAILGEPNRILPTGLYIAQYDLENGKHLNIYYSSIYEEHTMNVSSYEIIE